MARTDWVAEKMSHASAHVGIEPPQQGNQFECEQCGMTIEVTRDCHSDHPVHFECCGHEMRQVE